MTTLKWPFKDPDEVLDYVVDWETRLDGDTISTSDWAITPVSATDPLTEDSASNTTTRATIWLSGGLLDEIYEITNTIVTVGARTMEQTVKLKIKEK